MCDYSLEHVKSRAAKVGDKIVSTAFTNTITRGFASAEDPSTAVCLLPGTEIGFDNNIVADHVLGFFPSKKFNTNVAIFREVQPETPHVHHDSLELATGQTILVTRLLPGQQATVLQLPVDAKSTKVLPGGLTLAAVVQQNEQAAQTETVG